MPMVDHPAMCKVSNYNENGDKILPTYPYQYQWLTTPKCARSVFLRNDDLSFYKISSCRISFDFL